MVGAGLAEVEHHGGVRLDQQVVALAEVNHRGLAGEQGRAHARGGRGRGYSGVTTARVMPASRAIGITVGVGIQRVLDVEGRRQQLGRGWIRSRVPSPGPAV